MVKLRPVKLSSGISWVVNEITTTFTVMLFPLVATTVLKFVGLEETVSNVTEVVSPVPVALEVPLQVGFPDGKVAVTGLGIALKVTCVPCKTYNVEVASVKDELLGPLY